MVTSRHMVTILIVVCTQNVNLIIRTLWLYPNVDFQRIGRCFEVTVTLKC